ncbi:MAG: hypothetical protein AAFN74_22490, partial [Myxococcota bacterium]
MTDMELQDSGWMRIGNFDNAAGDYGICLIADERSLGHPSPIGEAAVDASEVGKLGHLEGIS